MKEWAPRSNCQSTILYEILEFLVMEAQLADPL